MFETNRFVLEARKKAQTYDKYSGCSQSVLASLQETFNIGDIESFKATTVLSGGIARSGETCGALIGALSALGLVIGRAKIEDTEQYRQAMIPAREICSKFKDTLKIEFGFREKLNTTLCRDIQEKIYGSSFDLNDPERFKEFIDAGGHSDKGCFKTCGIAAQIGAEKIIELTQRKG